MPIAAIVLEIDGSQLNNQFTISAEDQPADPISAQASLYLPRWADAAKSRR